MSMGSDRQEHREEEERKKRLAKIGNDIRSLPTHEQRIAKEALAKAGINVDEAMHQSARSRWDPYW